MPGAKPICFMVMPYGRKKTGVALEHGPTEINFDALWDRAFRPMILGLGYEPVRADQDVGALIIHEMLERLYFSDLVIADMTIPNGNVYYEVGIRHACKRTGCVLVAANWSAQLFDVGQMRTIRYPLAEGDIVEDTASAISAAVRARLPTFAAGASPMYEVLPGFPDAVDASRASSIRSLLDALCVFQAKASAVRAAPKAERKDRALELIAEYGRPPILPQIAYGLLKVLEDCGAWTTILEFGKTLPQEIAGAADFIELENLARSKVGNHLEAIGALEALLATSGATSEREGLLGGRYKRLFAQATDIGDRARYLNAAIQHYERGMMLDLNDFYPSSNLPGLYRERGNRGDDERAKTVAQIVYYACRRTKEREPNHPWVRPTLLVAAFDAGDCASAESLYEEIVAEGARAWQLASALEDIERSLKRVVDPERRLALRGIFEQLKTLL